jgi:hypothetical protein
MSQPINTLTHSATLASFATLSNITVEAIEYAVAQLQPADFAKFQQWFANFEATVWDAKIEADAAAGKLDEFAAEALAEYNAGKVREI